MNAKYNINNLKADLNLVKQSRFYLLSEQDLDSPRRLYLEEYKEGKSLMSYIHFDRIMDKFVTKKEYFSNEDIYLCDESAVELEYDKILLEIPKDIRKRLTSIVSEKMEYAYWHGYNGGAC